MADTLFARFRRLMMGCDRGGIEHAAHGHTLTWMTPTNCAAMCCSCGSLESAEIQLLSSSLMLCTSAGSTGMAGCCAGASAV